LSRGKPVTPNQATNLTGRARGCRRGLNLLLRASVPLARFSTSLRSRSKSMGTDVRVLRHRLGLAIDWLEPRHRFVEELRAVGREHWVGTFKDAADSLPGLQLCSVADGIIDTRSLPHGCLASSFLRCVLSTSSSASNRARPK